MTQGKSATGLGLTGRRRAGRAPGSNRHVHHAGHAQKLLNGHGVLRMAGRQGSKVHRLGRASSDHVCAADVPSGAPAPSRARQHTLAHLCVVERGTLGAAEEGLRGGSKLISAPKLPLGGASLCRRLAPWGCAVTATPQPHTMSLTRAAPSLPWSAAARLKASLHGPSSAVGKGSDKGTGCRVKTFSAVASHPIPPPTSPPCPPDLQDDVMLLQEVSTGLADGLLQVLFQHLALHHDGLAHEAALVLLAR